MFTECSVLFVWARAPRQAGARPEKFEQRLPVQPHGTVEISNVAGRIDVQGWDNPEVEVRGDIGEGVEKVDFNTDHGHTVIKVRVPEPFLPQRLGGSADPDSARQRVGYFRCQRRCRGGGCGRRVDGEDRQRQRQGRRVRAGCGNQDCQR